ncbi:hypothetical protein CH352_02435 [Leptospira hartskeerlii]|uniref:Uncharacterized protein n=1 Tax=Leptospira hartskeerlii TaxID=2023177 RepID=A0A2M9XDF8_9LEPT|nr:hypothetical protein CH357_08540 [Leptospira hartskeerlii]PJZ35487.1 hypothetical protein CH352_02435 [Leptospira hartskeerlii]
MQTIIIRRFYKSHEIHKWKCFLTGIKIEDFGPIQKEEEEKDYFKYPSLKYARVNEKFIIKK